MESEVKMGIKDCTGKQYKNFKIFLNMNLNECGFYYLQYFIIKRFIKKTV